MGGYDLNNKKRKLKIRLSSILICILILGLIALISNIYISNNIITINTYQLETDKINTDLKIAFISDLHSKEFGKNNEELLNKIKEQQPDLVAVGGDMNLKESTDYSVCLSLMKELVNVAPVYYTLGNHELEILDNTDFVQDIKSAGVHLLINEMESFYKNGESITIGGIKNYPYFEQYAPDFDNDENRFLHKYLNQESEHYSILLCHYPECYLWKFNQLNIDLMLSGHTHGGLVRIPFVGGLVAPEQGLFPKYDMGYFESDTAKMIITSGLGKSGFVPRINNQPEICIININ